jgi:carbonic anhydrase/acetyltransferase-like protein (isoleucine patch superfamily)
MDAFEVVMDEAGRITLPAELRERLGWRPGAVLTARAEAGGLALRASRGVTPGYPSGAPSGRSAPEGQRTFAGGESPGGGAPAHSPAGRGGETPGGSHGEPIATIREQARQLADAMRGLADTKEVRSVLASLGLGTARPGASESGELPAAEERPPAAGRRPPGQGPVSAVGGQRAAVPPADVAPAVPAPAVAELAANPGRSANPIRSFDGHVPRVPETGYVDPTAVLIGQVVLGEWCSVWPGAVLRGDAGAIQVGDRTNIQDGAVLHAHPEHGPVTVGRGVTVGHGATLHSCFVADHVLIGMRAVVLDGARIGEGAIIGAGAVVTPGTVVPPGGMALGVPARVTRSVTPEEGRSIGWHADGYVALQARYRGVSVPESVAMPDLPLYPCRRAAGPLVVDGSLDEAAWGRATPVQLLLTGGGAEPRLSTEARLCWDDRCLYVAFSCKDTDIWGSFTQRDDPLYNEEVVELFLCPTGDLRHYFELEVSPLNTLFDAKVFSPEGDRRSMLVQTEWDAPGIRTAVRVAGTLHDRTDVDLGWIAEIAIPFADLGLPGSPAAGDRWRVNLYRIERGEVEEYSAWSPTLKIPADFHVPDRFGILEFVEE